MDVTIICPTFNRGHEILETIETVQRQTVRDWSLIVVSDASTDETDETVRRASSLDSRIELLRTESNFGGPSGPTNLALSKVETEWVAYVDHDDLWQPNHLETLAWACEGGADLVSTLAQHVDGEGRIEVAAEPLNAFWHPSLQLIAPIFHNSTVAHRLELCDRAGGWNEVGSGLEDWDLWLRFAGVGAAVQAVAEQTVEVRRSGSTLLSTITLDGFYPIAVFSHPLDARRHLRALSRPAIIERFMDAARRDTIELLRSVDRSAELVHPLGWDSGLEAAIERAELSAPPEAEAQAIGLEIRPDQNGRHAIGWPMVTMSQEHADRIVSAGGPLLPATHELVCELLPADSRFGATDGLPEATGQ